VLARDAAATFVAKAEVARWPLFGLAARLTGTIFVQRVGGAAKTQSEEMRRRLLAGENLMLFPEGTSTDGSGVAFFKSSLFAMAERLPPGVDLAVQPVALTYTRALDGTPLTGPLRELYCWFGDATMFPHLMRMLSLPGAEVEVRFLDPIPAAGLGRKELARRAQAEVAGAVARANAGMAEGPLVAAPERQRAALS
jgi:1-acyl-sn-glycerol-3-phosphate acyltransferase